MSAASIIGYARFAAVAGLHMPQTPHPALTPADLARMSPAELAHFTDTPVAHVAAFADFMRQSRASALAVQFDASRFEVPHAGR